MMNRKPCMYVSDYSSSEEDEVENSEPPRKHRRQTRVWLEREIFQSPEEAVAAVQARQIWKISSSQNSARGKRV